MKAEIEWRKFSDSWPSYTSRILVLHRTINDQWGMKLLLYYAPEDEFTLDGRYFHINKPIDKNIIYWAYFPEMPEYPKDK